MPTDEESVTGDGLRCRLSSARRIGQTNDPMSVSGVEPIDDVIDDEGPLSEGNLAYLANLKDAERLADISNRNTADKQFMRI